MDQSAGPQPAFELPSQGAAPNHASNQEVPMAPEVPGAASQEQLMNPGNVPGGAPMQPMAPPPPIAAIPTTPDPAAGLPTAPVAATSGMTAGDADLIEKEWVNKAKAIVEATSHDPYAQNKEINKVKADYLKKRYNKDLPVTDK